MKLLQYITPQNATLLMISIFLLFVKIVMAGLVAWFLIDIINTLTFPLENTLSNIFKVVCTLFLTGTIIKLGTE